MKVIITIPENSSNSAAQHFVNTTKEDGIIHFMDAEGGEFELNDCTVEVENV